MSIKILTDTGCDLPADIIEKYDIDVLPLTVINDGEEYLDEIDIEPIQVYQGMRNGNTYSTAQVGPNILLEKFSNCAKNNEKAIYICFSSGLSGLYQTAKMLRDDLKLEYPNLDLEIIDSRAAACGFGLIVHEAAKMAKDNKTKDEILATIDYYIKNMKHIISVEEMTYLYKGGRIGPVQALAGGLLNIKPILGIDDEGKLIYQDKARGSKKLYKKIIEIMKKDDKDFNLKDQVIGMVHGDNLESAEEMKRLIEEEIGPKELIIHTIGTTVAAHTGPSIIGITYLVK